LSKSRIEEALRWILVGGRIAIRSFIIFQWHGIGEARNDEPGICEEMASAETRALGWQRNVGDCRRFTIGRTVRPVALAFIPPRDVLGLSTLVNPLAEKAESPVVSTRFG
jgi:hypothetical protein